MMTIANRLFVKNKTGFSGSRLVNLGANDSKLLLSLGNTFLTSHRDTHTQNAGGRTMAVNYIDAGGLQSLDAFPSATRSYAQVLVSMPTSRLSAITGTINTREKGSCLEFKYVRSYSCARATAGAASKSMVDGTTIVRA